jgi:hypothetical protein
MRRCRRGGARGRSWQASAAGSGTPQGRRCPRCPCPRGLGVMTSAPVSGSASTPRNLDRGNSRRIIASHFPVPQPSSRTSQPAAAGPARRAGPAKKHDVVPVGRLLDRLVATGAFEGRRASAPEKVAHGASRRAAQGAGHEMARDEVGVTVEHRGRDAPGGLQPAAIRDVRPRVRGVPPEADGIVAAGRGASRKPVPPAQRDDQTRQNPIPSRHRVSKFTATVYPEAVSDEGIAEADALVSARGGGSAVGSPQCRSHGPRPTP